MSELATSDARVRTKVLLLVVPKAQVGPKEQVEFKYAEFALTVRLHARLCDRHLDGLELIGERLDTPAGRWAAVLRERAGDDVVAVLDGHGSDVPVGDAYRLHASVDGWDDEFCPKRAAQGGERPRFRAVIVAACMAWEHREQIQAFFAPGTPIVAVEGMGVKEDTVWAIEPLLRHLAGGGALVEGQLPVSAEATARWHTTGELA